jgi:hypothetical protein
MRHNDGDAQGLNPTAEHDLMWTHGVNSRYSVTPVLLLYELSNLVGPDNTLVG